MQSAQFALVVSGAALCSLGVLRLTRIGLRRMPLPVATAAALAGVAVAVSGVMLRAPVPAPPGRRTAAPPSAPAASGSIGGTVRTPAGARVAAGTVALHRFEGTAQTETRDTRTDSSGAFRFESLLLGPRISYTVTTEHAGVMFRSGLVILDPHAPQRDVEIVVAETVDDASVLSIAVDSTVLVGEERGVEVVQVLNVENSSERAYVGPLRMPLLPRAQSLDPRKGLDRTRLSLESGELVSSAPVLPGSTEVVYTYTVPMPAEGLVAQRTFAYPTRRFALLVGDKLDAEAPALRAAGRVKLGERSYRSYRKTDLRTGASVKATVRPAGSATARTVAVAGAAVLALGAIAYPILRRRS